MPPNASKPRAISCEKRDILRKADVNYLDEIRKAGLYKEIWQAFAALLPVRTVGVMGDGRACDHVCALRTATRISNEVRGNNRVVYDVTSKPSGTIKWELGG